MKYITEIGWRIFYIILSLNLGIAWGVYNGEEILKICLQAWVIQWERDTIAYFHPDEVWRSYVKISVLISVLVIIPRIGIHIFRFVANRLKKNEQKAFIRTWLISTICLWYTTDLVFQTQRVGEFRNLSHFDEDVDLVYVPNLTSYVNNWCRVGASCCATSQLPLIWYLVKVDTPQEDLKDSIWNKLKYRLVYLVVFLIPRVASGLFIFDDLRIGGIWVIILRMVYYIVVLIRLVKEEYQIFFKEAYTGNLSGE